MALSVGRRLGPYEILGALGAGGTGEVYRATDTKLKRQVAIKVLPEALAPDTDRLARFQREAEVLAALNHPNIAAIYGLEDTDGSKALVMEGRGPDAGRPHRAGRDSRGRNPPHRETDRRSPRSCARAGDHSPRPEAGECEGQTLGPCEPCR